MFVISQASLLRTFGQSLLIFLGLEAALGLLLRGLLAEDPHLRGPFLWLCSEVASGARNAKIGQNPRSAPVTRLNRV